jgi:hypothetical protein
LNLSLRLTLPAAAAAAPGGGLPVTRLTAWPGLGLGARAELGATVTVGRGMLLGV